LIGYSEKTYGLDEALTGLRDRRTMPRIPLARGIRTLLLMFWVRIGSLNGIEEERPGGRWRRWLGGPIPSAATPSA
jgi:hypothetical protein